MLYRSFHNLVAAYHELPARYARLAVVTPAAAVEDAYNELLDGSGPVSIAGQHMWPSRILMQCDPVAYRTQYLDYINEEWLELDSGEFISADNLRELVEDWELLLPECQDSYRTDDDDCDCGKKNDDCDCEEK